MELCNIANPSPFCISYPVANTRILASNDCIQTVNLLSTVGYVHYQSNEMSPRQKKVFNEVIELVRERDFAGADELASSFPFSALVPSMDLDPDIVDSYHRS